MEFTSSSEVKVLYVPSLAHLPEEKKARIRDWIEALRSGKFVQCKGKLSETPVDFCCLGVGCELYSQKEGGSWRKGKDGLREFYHPNEVNVGWFSNLPPKVREWFGLFHNNGFAVQVETRFSGNLYKIEKAALDGLNDCYGFTFSDLARLIEISLEGGFGKMIDAPVSPFSKGN